MRAAALIIAILVTAVGAEAFYEPHTVSADLDGDGRREEARTVRIADPDEPDDDLAARTAVNVNDNCSTGPIDRRVAGPQDSLAFLKLYRADTRSGRELYVELRSGAAGRAGESHLVAWRRSGARGCGRPRDLFRYTTDRPTRRPRGARSFNNFAVYVRNFERRFAGREIRLDETFLRRGDGACCPSLQKRTWFRYDRRRDRYVRYGSRVSELRRGGGGA